MEKTHKSIGIAQFLSLEPWPADLSIADVGRGFEPRADMYAPKYFMKLFKGDNPYSVFGRVRGMGPGLCRGYYPVAGDVIKYDIDETAETTVFLITQGGLQRVEHFFKR